jgi:Holliday junction resolvase RusA-like endonuclease
MTVSISFVVPAIPVAQPRQRHRIVTARAGRTFVSNYTPTKHPVNHFKAAVQLAAQAVYAGPVLDCPLCMDVLFVFPRPASLPKKRGTGRLPHTAKPDRDNCMKAVQDALEGILFRNDSQISSGQVMKRVAASGEQPHVAVVITEDAGEKL